MNKEKVAKKVIEEKVKGAKHKPGFPVSNHLQAACLGLFGNLAGLA